MSGATERRGLLQKSGLPIKTQRTGMAKTMPVRVFSLQFGAGISENASNAPVPIKESGCFGFQKQK